MGIAIVWHRCMIHGDEGRDGDEDRDEMFCIGIVSIFMEDTGRIITNEEKNDD